MSQADSPNSMSPSRRAFLAGAPAVAVAALAAGTVVNSFATAAASPVAPAALAPAVATPSPDAGLLQLFDQYLATDAEYVRLYASFERGRNRHRAKHPMPDALLVQPGDAEFGLPEGPDGLKWSGSYFSRVHLGAVCDWRGGAAIPYEPPSEAARARAEEIVAAHDKWHRKYWGYPREVRSVEREADRARKLRDRLRSKIDRTRALTIAGLAVKAQVAAIEGEDDTQFADTTLASILRDMRALAKIGA